MSEKLEVTLALCAIHASELGNPKPQLGYAKGKCFACSRHTILHVAGKDTVKDPRQSGRLETDADGQIWFISLKSEL